MHIRVELDGLAIAERAVTPDEHQRLAELADDAFGRAERYIRAMMARRGVRAVPLTVETALGFQSASASPYRVRVVFGPGDVEALGDQREAIEATAADLIHDAVEAIWLRFHDAELEDCFPAHRLL